MNQYNINWKELSVPKNCTITFNQPPRANWRFYFGGKQKLNAYFEFYLEKPPNRFQRWMMSKVLGIYWEAV